jgi:hypothetical protein
LEERELDIVKAVFVIDEISVDGNSLDLLGESGNGFIGIRHVVPETELSQISHGLFPSTSY